MGVRGRGVYGARQSRKPLALNPTPKYPNPFLRQLRNLFTDIIALAGGAVAPGSVQQALLGFSDAATIAAPMVEGSFARQSPLCSIDFSGLLI